MKANAPEKIYIQSFNVSEEDAKFARKLYFDDVWTEEPEPGQENIEYTRTDAFIENAKKWFEEHFENRLKWEITTYEFEDMQSMVEDFKNYMKGE